MDLSGLARLLAWHALWRATGATRAGRAIVEALGSPDDGVRTTAGMLLVKSPARARPLLRAALGRREHLPMVLAVLGDVGDQSDESRLAPFVEDPDPVTARAAADALRVLRARG